MLTVKGIRKRFGATEVLKGIDLEIHKGDVVAILGPSGSGKTTLLRCLNFLEEAEEGSFVFDGESYAYGKLSKKTIAQIRKKSAFVFQNFNLFRNKTALQNVTEGPIVAGKMPRREAEILGKQALDKVGLADKYDAYPHQLSGGQQQRVGIARAIVSNPEIIYFDEPTSSLDPELVGEVLSVMRRLAEEGMTMLVVTHELSFARQVANKVIFMEDGKVLEAGDSKAFFSRPASERAAEFLGSISECMQ